MAEMRPEDLLLAPSRRASCTAVPACVRARPSRGRGRFFQLHDSVAGRNGRTANAESRLQEQGANRRRGRRQSDAENEAAFKDGKQENENALRALNAEFEKVAGLLRSALCEPGAETVAVSKVRDEEDDGGEESQESARRQRLLAYRFIRKIEEPPPPLQALDHEPLPKKRTDKIEQNRTGDCLLWYREAKQRLEQSAQRYGERLAQARQLRDEGDAHLAEFHERRCVEIETAHAANLQMLEAERRRIIEERALRRNERFTNAIARKEAVEALKLEKVRAEAATKRLRLVRGGGGSLSPSPRTPKTSPRLPDLPDAHAAAAEFGACLSTPRQSTPKNWQQRRGSTGSNRASVTVTPSERTSVPLAGEENGEGVDDDPLAKIFAYVDPRLVAQESGGDKAASKLEEVAEGEATFVVRRESASAAAPSGGRRRSCASSNA